MSIFCSVFFFSFSFLCYHSCVHPTPPSLSPPGGSEAIRPGRPAVRRVPGHALRWQVCAVLLRQCHLPPVLLRVLLGSHPLPGRPRVPQAPGEGGRGPAATHLLPLELSRPGGGGMSWMDEGLGGLRVGEWVRGGAMGEEGGGFKRRGNLGRGFWVIL